MCTVHIAACLCVQDSSTLKLFRIYKCPCQFLFRPSQQKNRTQDGLLGGLPLPGGVFRQQSPGRLGLPAQPGSWLQDQVGMEQREEDGRDEIREVGADGKWKNITFF